MLKEVALFSFSPLALLASLQTSVIQARNPRLEFLMSLIKRSDVKNHLSSHHRTEIHLAHPQSQSDATGFAHDEDEMNVGDPVENPVTTPTPNKPETTPTIAYKSAKA